MLNEQVRPGAQGTLTTACSETWGSLQELTAALQQTSYRSTNGVRFGDPLPEQLFSNSQRLEKKSGVVLLLFRFKADGLVPAVGFSAHGAILLQRPTLLSVAWQSLKVCSHWGGQKVCVNAHKPLLWVSALRTLTSTHHFTS